MKNKRIIVLILAILVVIAAVIYVGVRLHNRGTDIIGVTTLENRNTIIMNSKSGQEFVAGSGKLTVGTNERIHVVYELDNGSFDLAFHKGSDGLDVFENSDLKNLSNTGDVFGKSGISGKGSLDLEVASGKYTVYFNQHGAVGSATVTTKKP